MFTQKINGYQSSKQTLKAQQDKCYVSKWEIEKRNIGQDFVC